MEHLDQQLFSLHNIVENNSGILLINKPLKWTSFDVIKRLRNSFPRKTKVGHAGTLDPLATGLLIVCVGSCTKKINEFVGLEKKYSGTFNIGSTTLSYDLETAFDECYAIDHITEKMLTETAASFVGSIEQEAPSYSALKVKGKRMYDLIRKDGLHPNDIEKKVRTIEIKDFSLRNTDLPEIGFSVTCSKGTYIRSLANDFGKALNAGAHLSSLCRDAIGEFELTNAYELTDLINQLQNIKKEDLV